MTHATIILKHGFERPGVLEIRVGLLSFLP